MKEGLALPGPAEELTRLTVGENEFVMTTDARG
jgi:hypothetical protein